MPSPILMAPSGKYMKAKYNQPRADEELYDLKFDPNEQINLIQMPEYKNIADDLRIRLDLWLKNTYDPILQGKVNPQPQVKYKYDTP